ncbi:MAG: hypothetical protein WA584_23615 [Pyrinomonadaceae bacterium]
MSWQKKNYKIRVKDGSERWYDGIASGAFALNFGCELTHLKSGSRIAQFRFEEDGKRVGDYLNENFAVELEVLDKAIKRNMTFQDLKNLPEILNFTRRCKSDAVLMDMLHELEYRQEETDGDAG